MTKIMISKQATICLQHLVFCGLICLMTFVNGFPSQCKDDKFFDQLKQNYLPCSECDKKEMGCRVCCPTSKPDLIDASMSSHTAPMPSMEEKSDRAKYHVLHVFLLGFIILMVVCTLLVLVYVAYKVSRDRQAAQCQHGNHFHNVDVNNVQEVFTVDAPPVVFQGGIHESAPVNHQAKPKKDSIAKQAENITVNKLSELGVKSTLWEQKL